MKTLLLVGAAMLAGCASTGTPLGTFSVFHLVNFDRGTRTGNEALADEYLCYLEAKNSIPALTTEQLVSGTLLGPVAGGALSGFNAKDRRKAMKPIAADCLERRGYTVTDRS